MKLEDATKVDCFISIIRLATHSAAYAGFNENANMKFEKIAILNQSVAYRCECTRVSFICTFLLDTFLLV